MKYYQNWKAINKLKTKKMKKLILTIIAVLAFNLSNAQSFKSEKVEDIPQISVVVTDSTMTIGSEYGSHTFKITSLTAPVTELGGSWIIDSVESQTKTRYTLYPFDGFWWLKMEVIDTFTNNITTATLKLIKEKVLNSEANK